MNMEIPEIRKARMIDTRRLEVFWSQAVVNSQYSENIGVYHKGRRIATYSAVMMRNGTGEPSTRKENGRPPIS